METQHQERSIEKVQETETEKAGKQQSAAGNSGSPSASSSPSHEFSFTVSLNTSQTATATATTATTATTPAEKARQPPFAIDLSPADEIFFHGHLLPLHFLSHLHHASNTSPRSSTNSLDSFTLPIKDLLHQDQKPITTTSTMACTCEDDDCISYDNEALHEDTIGINFGEKERNTIKSKPFSLFSLTKWRKTTHDTKENQNQHKRKLKFDVSQFLKRYIKMVKPLLSAKGGGERREKFRVRRQSYSFSGALSPRDKREAVRGRRGEFSAPASMRTSPTNSGLLLATAGVPSPPASDSTMEELQAAIQAAIAHCKNSIAAQDKNLSVPVN